MKRSLDPVLVNELDSAPLGQGEHYQVSPPPPPPPPAPASLSTDPTHPHNTQVHLTTPNDLETAITYCTAANFGSHPLGIEPEGNRYFSETESIRESGLGLLAHFEDSFIIDNILSYCDPMTLLKLESLSKAFYALIVGSDVELWKDPTVEMTQGDFIFQWRWRLTYIIEFQLRHNIPNPTIPRKYVNMYNNYQDVTALEGFIQAERDIYEGLKKQSDNNTTYTLSLQFTDPADYTPNPNTTAYINDTTRPKPIKDVHPEPMRFATTYPPQLLHLYPNREASLPPVKCKGFYSDELFQPWSTIAFFHNSKDLWRRERNVERVDIATIGIEEFQEKYGRPGKPVVLTNVVTNWPAVTEKEWGLDKLLGKGYSRIGLKYLCGVAHLTLDKYLLYASRCDDDDTPTYLFDKTFGETNPHILDQYIYPTHFQEDYFQYLSNHTRPPFRWWLVGPHRSSSSFHQDPLSTCAQNVLIQGLKKWVLYPPHITPPGIIASDDKLQVTAPFNAVEWYNNFYKHCKAKECLNRPPVLKNNNTNTDATDHEKNHSSSNGSDTIIAYDYVIDYPKQCSHYSQFQPVEILQRPGECVYVPSTWWHTVINLDYGIAVTQNQLTDASILAAETLLTKINRISLRDDLLQGVEAKHPGLITNVRQKQDERFKVLQRYHQSLKDKAGLNNGVKGDEKKVTVEVKRELIAMLQAPSKSTMCCDSIGKEEDEDAASQANQGAFSFAFDDDDDDDEE